MLNWDDYTKLTREFVAIAAHCLETGKGHCIKGGKFLAVDRLAIEELLNRNKYLEAATKLDYWKNLRWIDVDYKQLTKKVRVAGGQKRMVVIALSAHETLPKTQP